MFERYGEKSNDPKRNAQANLHFRTNYVTDETLAYFKGRVLTSYHWGHRLLFAVLTSEAAKMDGTGRVYSYAIFDVFGWVVTHKGNKEERTYNTQAKAKKAMVADLAILDPIAITREAIERTRKHHARDLADLAAQVDIIETHKAKA